MQAPIFSQARRHHTLHSRHLDELDLTGSAIEELPENLSVTFTLFLADSAIRALPERIHVGETAYLGGTALPRTAVPRSFKTGRKLEVDWDWRP
ncbi:hypothetical protein [Pseudomonas tohonis]|uniref:hypothetical protein n=1 Tax=Pseudomonas tohonis TaxID=2725477 RepID=UPI0021DADEE1|nr:hypothetical protein [Pseudomonas tohonis]UXY50565.1 hypothetical protein N9L84_16420 [Pseudomonas tohonis]